VALNVEDAGRVIQFLGHILTDALHGAAARADRGFGFVVNVGPRQIRRQWLAFSLAFRLCWRCGELRQFFFHRRQVGINGFLEQLPLLDWPVLGLHPEAPALVHGQFMGEFVNLALPPAQLTILLVDQRITLGNLQCQTLRQLAKFFGSQLVKIGRQRHDRHDAGHHSL